MSTSSYKHAFLVSVARLAPHVDMGEVERAYDFSEKVHRDQKRENGEPFITHPAATALYLAKIGLDTTTICAGLLHDTAEDSGIAIEELEKNFGPDVAFLVQGATKISNPAIYTREESQIKTLQRMFLAMAKDIRAVLVKLADRLHNMETLYAKPTESQIRIAQGTMDIYAPIANRLGMGELKGLLEDLSFEYLFPQEYEWIKSYGYENIEAKIQFMAQQQEVVQQLLEESGIKVVKTDGRVKHKFSLYTKLQRYGNDLRSIYDLVAMRVIVPDISSCYEAMGVIHKNFAPVPGRIKDYIAVPKPNGYKSLHTTVRVSHDETVEIQIRTEDMHREAEYGVAAHWVYKEGESSAKNGVRKLGKVQKKELAWIEALSQWQSETTNTQEYFEALKIDFFKDRIYVRTPKGDVFDLPEGASPIDFAYRVHTEIGNKCVGARVNGKMVKMDYALQNNDVVEILTISNAQGPKRKWIDYAKTHNARNKIRAWLRKLNPEENVRIGREIVERYIQLFTKLKLDQLLGHFTEADKSGFLKSVEASTADELFEAIGNGSVTVDTTRAKMKKNNPELYERIENFITREGLQKESVPMPTRTNIEDVRVVVNADQSLASSMAKCCDPKPFDKIIAYITKKKGITVHREDCVNVKTNLISDKFVSAIWHNQDEILHKMHVQVIVQRQPGVMRDITSELSNAGIGVTNMQAEILDAEHAQIDLHLVVSDLAQMNKLFTTIETLDFVQLVTRV